MEVNTMEEGNPESNGELQRAFGNPLRFPIHRQAAESQTTMDRTSSK